VATVDLTRVCSSSDPALVHTEPGFDGLHTVKLVGMIEGLAVIESNETQFSLSCDENGWLSSGCAAGGDGRSSVLPLLAGLLAVASRRSRKNG
jgi:hypothetical protein